ncbi:MAG: hypothetical protein R3F35_04075 [Myxococcota bacterium]
MPLHLAQQPIHVLKRIPWEISSCDGEGDHAAQDAKDRSDRTGPKWLRCLGCAHRDEPQDVAFLDRAERSITQDRNQMSVNIQPRYLRVRGRERREVIGVPLVERRGDREGRALRFHRERAESKLRVDLVDDLLSLTPVGSDLLPLAATRVMDHDPIRAIPLTKLRRHLGITPSPEKLSHGLSDQVGDRGIALACDRSERFQVCGLEVDSNAFGILHHALSPCSSSRPAVGGYLHAKLSITPTT